ncbi:hypothetical protein ABEB36_003368 [Hypothenemus hampei]|uniref:Uncharacterized protein n=1 Tax=Hypothenemus hampei TaxID=57062 RepID=A0ABD1F8X0_HYPHA
MDDLRGKLRDETELVKLTGRSLFGFLGKGVDQRAVIGFYNEGAAIKHVAKEFDAGKDCEEFPIIGAVPGFSRAELPGKKTKSFHVSFTSCSKEAPMARSEASVERASGAEGDKKVVVTADEMLDLHRISADSSSGVQLILVLSFFFAFFKSSLRGA